MRKSDFYNDNWCANCEAYIANAKATGVSSLYNPNGKAILLCEPCFFVEDELIECLGRNNQPEILARYMANIAKFPY